MTEREQRLIYGEDAELYDRARPKYPDRLIEDVVALVGGSPQIVDAGCGTGKATMSLAARGARGVGVEADSAMAAVARRNLEGQEIRIDVSLFEDWAPARGDGTFDLVVSAQAWHWFAPEVRFQKAYSLLRSGGWLALWWNGHSGAESAARKAMDSAYERFAPELAYRGMSGMRRPDFGPLPEEVRFGPPIERTYPWLERYSSAAWVDLLRTHSDHRMLAEDQRTPLLEAVGRAIDSQGGIYDHPYVCELWAAQRI